MEKVQAQSQNHYQDMSQITAKLIELRNVTPHTTKYGGDKGVMKFLKFDLMIEVSEPAHMQEDTEINLSGSEDNAAYQVGTVTQTGNLVTTKKQIAVDCPIFPQRAIAFLSINRNENEIVSVKEEGLLL